MATHKYATSERWQWECEHDIRLSDHALERWSERTPVDAVSPEHAWEHGADVPDYALGFFRNRWDKPADGARVYHEREAVSEPYQGVLVVHDDVVTTMLRVEWIDEGPMRALLDALKYHVNQAEGRL